MNLNNLALFSIAYAATGYELSAISDFSVLTSYGSAVLESVKNWDYTYGYATSIFSEYVSEVPIVISHLEQLGSMPADVMSGYTEYVSQIHEILSAISVNLWALGESANEDIDQVYGYYLQNLYLSETIWNISPDCSSWQATFSPEYSSLSYYFSYASDILDFSSPYYTFEVHTCSSTSQSASSASSSPSATATIRCLVKPTDSGEAATSSQLLY